MGYHHLMLLLFGLSIIPPASVLAQGCPLYLSTDQGTTWTDYSAGLPGDADVNGLLEHDNTLIVITRNQGVFTLAEGKTRWQPSSKGLPLDNEFFHPLCLVARGSDLVMGTFAHGIFVSRDGGGSWQPSNYFMNEIVGSLYFDGDTLLAGTRNGLYRSSDRGDNWQKWGEDLTNVNVITSYNDQIFVASQNGIGILSGDQIEWQDLKTDWAIINLLQDDNFLYAQSARKEIHRSKTGTDWEGSNFVFYSLRGGLIDFLWRGLEVKLPGGDAAGTIQTSSRGWFVGLASGC
jgi:hypothetical protein